MNKNTFKERIIALDLMRVFAVVNMIQGHTLDVLLSSAYRSREYIAYSIWHFNRGITAPVFLFTAGAVFSYIFLRKGSVFFDNPRVKIGIRRALSLIIIGYLIRIPDRNFLSFGDKPVWQLQRFFSVDVLQLIGVGLLLILVIFCLCEKLKLSRIMFFLLLSLLIILLTPLVDKTNWEQFTPLFLAGYMNKKIGSNFPLFPYVVYMFCGAAFGTFLTFNRTYCKSYRFVFSIFIAGIMLIIVYTALNKIRFQMGESLLMNMRGNIVFLRSGMVLLFVSLIILASKKVQNLHWTVSLLARNSLSIYVIHLFILYGSAWNRGILYYYGRSLGPYSSVICCVIFIMLLAMFCSIYEKTEKKIKAYLG